MKNLELDRDDRPSVLKIERIKAGRSQQRLANETDINVVYLGLIERCQLKAAHDQVRRICKVLEMKPEQLFYDDGEACRINA